MADLIRDLFATKSTLLADVEGGDGGRLLVRSDIPGTMQLFELVPGSGLRQLTDLPDPVATAKYVPGSRRAVLEVDRGGDERHQLYLLELEGASEPVRRSEELHPLTSDPRFGHHFAGCSPDGIQVAYVSNRANGVDFDLWICDLPADAHRLLFAPGAWCQPGSGFSPDGRWISVLVPGRRPLDTQLHLVEVASGRAREVLPHPGEAAEVGAPRWLGPGDFAVASNVGRDRSEVLRWGLETGAPGELRGGSGEWDREPVASADGERVLLVENRNGTSRMLLVDLTADGPPREIPLPEPGVVISHSIPQPRFSPDGRTVYFNFTSPRQAGDVWAHDLDRGTSERLTTSPAAVEPEQLATAEEAVVASFDGERVPLFLFRPNAGEGRPPVVVLVHGGPESQSVLQFNPSVQSLAMSGFAVVVPNVRGSTGYGKRYAGLDDTTRRQDSVSDLAAVHGWLEGAGLDPLRAALWGGSYGGYMVLAGLAFEPHLWAAGVDIVGISDLVTFLQNTSPYRRAHRELEYGSLSRDREFLESASPLRHAREMRAPLFVIHGRNDPRVPVGEAEQLVRELRERQVPCELLIYEDEGHGLARLENRLDAFPRAIRFLEQILQP